MLSAEAHRPAHLRRLRADVAVRVLVGCEFSGVVRDAFIARGHDAMSCDIIPSERPGPHYIGDVMDLLDDDWDLGIFHPPCTFLARSGARWWNDPGRAELRESGLRFIRDLMEAPIERIAVENPPGAVGTNIRPADQYIQPWEFGHGEVKMTGLWLKSLPLLVPTHIVEGRLPRTHYAAPGPERWKARSRTLQGIADAMADQWGGE